LWQRSSPFGTGKLHPKTPDVQLNSKEQILETFHKLHSIPKKEYLLNSKEEDEDHRVVPITVPIAKGYGVIAIC
jgi:hypothetical protein